MNKRELKEELKKTSAGRMSKPILEDCSILCQITANELEG